MLDNENIFHSKIIKLFPFLSEEQFPEIEEFKNAVIYSKIPHGKLITLEGDSCGYLSFVISGIVRVYKTGETGREITLYRLYEGDSCILTASCIVSNSTFPAFSVAETDVEVFSIPSNLFSSWIKKYDVWQKFIFNLITERLTDIISVVEEIAFRHIDVRIADRLSKLYDEYGNTIKITHHELASDIGSSREVVSRVLKDFEEKQIIIISRGSIEITKIDFLKDYTKKI
jgi:CRP/FNR family transcriptional regulator, anaerobic regulatory protein